METLMRFWLKEAKKICNLVNQLLQFRLAADMRIKVEAHDAIMAMIQNLRRELYSQYLYCTPQRRGSEDCIATYSES